LHIIIIIITGLPTHSVGGQTSKRSLVSVVVVCNTRICNVTHQGAARGGPVMLRPSGRHLVIIIMLYTHTNAHWNTNL